MSTLHIIFSAPACLFLWCMSIMYFMLWGSFNYKKPFHYFIFLPIITLIYICAEEPRGWSGVLAIYIWCASFLPCLYFIEKKD